MCDLVAGPNRTMMRTVVRWAAPVDGTGGMTARQRLVDQPWQRQPRQEAAGDAGDDEEEEEEEEDDEENEEEGGGGSLGPWTEDEEERGGG